MTEKETYLEGLRKKFASGMTRVGFFMSGVKPKSEEALYAELNRMENAPDQSDVEVLGRFSP